MDAQVVTPRDVAFDQWQDWNHIPWSLVTPAVRRLQTRIAKAARENDWRRVKSLQTLLTHSTSAKALAVRRVTENQGRKTPGVDGETWSTPVAKWNAVQSLETHGYKPKPLRRVHIPKANGETRPLGIPTMKDRAMQALFLQALEPIAETKADTNSYGFRPERSTADAIVQCKNLLARAHSAKWVIDADIKGCFDNISHEWLLAHIPINKRVLSGWLKCGVVELGQRNPTEAGTPQGGIISPVLANMVLDGLERMVETRFSSRQHKVHLVRYADDFIVTGSSKELLETQVKPEIEAFLAERGLWLSPRKTRIVHITEGFDFLGWNVRWLKDGLHTTPSKKNRQAHYDKVRSTLREMRGARQIHLILKLNPILRGWAQYHQPVAVNEVWRKMDHKLWLALFSWSKRRHPNKGKRWVKKRYFTRVEGRDWTFADGPHRLWQYADFPHRVHAKIIGEANPYDPEWDGYLTARLGQRMAATLMGRRKLLWLWKQQNGTCLHCGQRITKQTPWDVHHKVKRTDGGSDKLTNLELLHRTCHKQLHAVEPKAVKPRAAKTNSG